MSLLRLVSAVALALASGCINLPTAGRGGIEVGERRYEDSAWGELEDQTVVGITAASRLEGNHFGTDAGLFWADAVGRPGEGGTGPRTSLDTFELYGGVMGVFDLVPNRLRVEAGCGGTLNYLYAHDPSQADGHYDHGAYLGGYVRAGLGVRVGGPLWLSLGARFVRGGEADVFDTRVDGDHDQFTFGIFFAD